MIRIAVVLVFAPMVAFAAPPPEGSDDWNLMAPYAAWIESQHTSDGKLC